MSNDLTGKLQVALVLPYPAYPAWQYRLATRLSGADKYELSVFGLEDDKSPRQSTLDPYSVWQALDARVFATDKEAADQRGGEERPLQVTHGDCVCKQVFRRRDQLVDHAAGLPLDVILWLLPGVPPKQLLGNARLGVWTLSSVMNEATGFWELVESTPIVSCELFTSESNPARHRLFGRAFAKTDHLSLAKTLRVVRAMDESLVVSKLNEVCRNGEADAKIPAADKRLPAGEGRPGLLRLLRALSGLYGQYIGRVLARQFRREQWQLAYRVGGERLSQVGLSRLAPDNQGFWADPFVTTWQDRKTIFFEEFEATTRKGRIAAMDVLPDGGVGPMKIALEQDYHLSYPFLFEHDGSLFMIPESADAGRVEAFRCLVFPDRWESHAVLLDNIRAFDATLVQHEGYWWMFAAVQQNGNSTSDELRLFYATDPFSEWTPHPMNPVSLDIRSARPGGAIYVEDGVLYRPAQDCSARYGYALSIQRIIRMDTEVYQEETVDQVLPNWADDIRGTHTVNQCDDIVIYDCEVRRRK